MSLLNDETNTESVPQRESFRITNVSSKLNQSETERLDALAKRHGLQRGEFIRQLILDELARDSGEPNVSPELIEIIGLRLMLTNLLEPIATGQRMTPETFAAIVAEVKKHKRNLAVQTWTDLERTL
jgi:Ribbon-helix-helix protein, copG family